MVRAEAPSRACQIRGTAVWQDDPHAASCSDLEPECADPRAAGPCLGRSGARGAPGGHLVLTEHVPSGKEPSLPQVLQECGAATVSVSEDRGAGDNRILIATKEPHTLGPIAQPELDLVSAHANFLCVTLASGVIGVGFRMPDYSKTPGGYALLWDWLFDALAPYRSRCLILAGDLNADFTLPCDRKLRSELAVIQFRPIFM
jgi:hypothetical protein